jgi:hypothetical protein
MFEEFRKLMHLTWLSQNSSSNFTIYFIINYMRVKQSQFLVHKFGYVGDSINM